MNSENQQKVISFLQENKRATARRRKQAKPSVTDVCRQNWQGYEIHKIFGSAGK